VALVTEHPDYARAWGGLASVSWTNFLGPTSVAQRAEADAAAARALKLNPNQPDALAVRAGQACRAQRWQDCLSLSRRIVAMAPSDSMWRAGLALQLATVGQVREALREIDAALERDPLSQPLHNWRARILDTLGRHEEAHHHYAVAGVAVSGQTAPFYNALWRDDLAQARTLALGLETHVPWRDSELAVVEARGDPMHWPAARSAIERAEAIMKLQGEAFPYDFSRWLLPERDFPREIEMLDAIQRAGYARFQLTLWMPSERKRRQTEAFQRYLRDSGLLAYWRANGWPDLCRSDGGDGVICD
jgi:tetratricopeptide (TPR) repeat protein